MGGPNVIGQTLACFATHRSVSWESGSRSIPARSNQAEPRTGFQRNLATHHMTRKAMDFSSTPSTDSPYGTYRGGELEHVSLARHSRLSGQIEYLV